MAKITYADGRTVEVADEDLFTREDVEKDFISKEDVEKDYVSRDQYDKKKEQAKNAFKDKDLAKKEALEEEGAKMESRIRDELKFGIAHWFDEIPDEVKEVKEKHPSLSWEEALKLSGYQATSDDNPNPGTAKIDVSKKTSITSEELASLPESQYNAVASEIEAGKVKLVD